MVISPTASWIRWCMQVYACELMWTCLFWTERSTPDSFEVPRRRFNSATGEQKWLTQTIYTDSEPPSRLPNSLMPSWEAQTSHILRLWCDAVGDRTLASHTPNGRSNHYATRGQSLDFGQVLTPICTRSVDVSCQTFLTLNTSGLPYHRTFNACNGRNISTIYWHVHPRLIIPQTPPSGLS